MTGITKWNPLFCSPSPRDIPEVLSAHDVIGQKYDRLYAKYLVERMAYKLLRNYFLEHEEYTHLVLCPDDLVIKPEDVDRLYQDLAELDLPILSGMCNVNLTEDANKYSFTENLPHPVRPMNDYVKNGRTWGWRWYAWYTDEAIKMEQDRQARVIIKVPHSGFALQAIRRDIVNVIDFQTDGMYNQAPPGFEAASTDVMFSNFCAPIGVPIFVDPRIKMLHLRNPGRVEITVNLNDITDGELRFYKSGAKDFELIPYDKKALLEPPKKRELEKHNP